MERRDRRGGPVAAVAAARLRGRSDGGLHGGRHVGGVGPVGVKQVRVEQRRETPRGSPQGVQDLRALRGGRLGQDLLPGPRGTGQGPNRTVHRGRHAEEAGDVCEPSGFVTD